MSEIATCPNCNSRFIYEQSANGKSLELRFGMALGALKLIVARSDIHMPEVDKLIAEIEGRK